MGTFPSKKASIRVYRHRQSPDSARIMTSTNVPCMVHIAGKPAPDPAAKTLHQAWLQCSEFAGLSDDEVEFGLVSALHSTWKSCVSAITPTCAEAAETSLTIACAEAANGDAITLEPIDALYAFEFYRLFKPNKSSTAIRLEWPSATIPSILRDLLADKSARLAAPFYLPGGTRINLLLRALPGPPGSQHLDATFQTNAEAADFARHSVILQFFYSKDKFHGFIMPPLSEISQVFTLIFIHHLDRNAMSVLCLFQQHLPGVPGAIPGQSSTLRGVALDLSLTSRFGDGGYRAFGAHYEELTDTNRVLMSVHTITAQIFAVLIDTVYLAPVFRVINNSALFFTCARAERIAPRPPPYKDYAYPTNGQHLTASPPWDGCLPRLPSRRGRSGQRASYALSGPWL